MIHTNSKEDPLPRKPGPVTPSIVGSGDVAVRSGSSHPAQGPFAWPDRFFRRHEIAYDWANVPWSKCHKFMQHFETPEDEIKFFLRSDDESARHEGRVRPVLDICSDVRLGDLLEGDNDGPQKKMGWLIDGSFNDKDGKWTSRPCLGALSARQLAFELLKKRYAIPGEIDNEPIDAERRLIYITDLDRWSILALVKTAPESLARLLGDFFQKHICARASVGVSFASNGPPIFALDFHMPFRVWRTGHELLYDKRTKKSNGKPLRSSRNMSFLMSPLATSTGLEVHGMYAGHVGCMIIGHDQWRWTAHLAIDTWFDTDEEDPGKVMRYHYDFQGASLDPLTCENDDANKVQNVSVELDPLSCGNDDAKKPIWNPRAYFLRIMGIRFGNVKDESELLFQNLNEGAINLAQIQTELLSNIRPFSTGSDLEQYGKEFETFEARLGQLKEVLQEVLHDLRDTLKMMGSFIETEVNYFLNYDGQPGDASECYPYLSEIRSKFNELTRLYACFENLKEKCKHMMETCEAARRKYFFQHGDPKSLDGMQNMKDMMALQVELTKVLEELKHLQATNRSSSGSSHGDIEGVRLQALNALVTSPFTHTAALFSADGVLGFHKNWRSFLLSLVFASGVVAVVSTGLKFWIRRTSHKVLENTSKDPTLPLYEDQRMIGTTNQALDSRRIHETPETGCRESNESESENDRLTWYTKRRLSFRPWSIRKRYRNSDDIELGTTSLPVALGQA